MNLVLLGGALGGIGLFLLGMRLMTDGLKLTAGTMLREFLAHWTHTRLRGLLSGILITGIVQSSSAVTVAAIGFVNAGVMTLGQTMWVIFGSNIGTTMTGWIVAIVGFDIKIEAFALPMLGAGMLLTLTGTSTRHGAFGEAIAGFGLFFLGISILKTTFAGLGESVDLAGLASGGIAGDALLVLIGFALTTMVQSSSAVIAIALTAASGGILTIESGAALVIGANVGTTSTAILAVLGATPNAKRVAVSHVVFNLLTGVVALALLPAMLFAVQLVERSLAMAAGPATTLALFHTVFNVLGVLLIWPLSDRLERWLAGRFVTAEENEARPRFLDRNSLEIPALAVNSILLELRRVAAISLDIARGALADPAVSHERLSRRSETVNRLNEATIGYIQNFHAVKKSNHIADAMTHPIRALWHFGEIGELAQSCAHHGHNVAALPAPLRVSVDAYTALAVANIDAAMRAFSGTVEETQSGPVSDPERSEQVYQQVKSDVLIAASKGELDAHGAETTLEYLSDLKMLLRHIDRAGKRMAAIAQAVETDGGEVEE